MRRRRDSGASLVEFALILPLLVLFLFGIVQFGLGYDRKQSVNSSAREGARLAALDSSTLRDIGERSQGAYNMAVAGGAAPTVEVRDDSDTLRGTVAPDGSFSGADPDDESAMPCGRSNPSSYVRVDVMIDYVIDIPLFGTRTVQIEARGEFRCE